MQSHNPRRPLCRFRRQFLRIRRPGRRQTAELNSLPAQIARRCPRRSNCPLLFQPHRRKNVELLEILFKLLSTNNPTQSGQAKAGRPETRYSWPRRRRSSRSLSRQLLKVLQTAEPHSLPVQTDYKLLEILLKLSRKDMMTMKAHSSAKTQPPETWHSWPRRQHHRTRRRRLLSTQPRAVMMLKSIRLSMSTSNLRRV